MASFFEHLAIFAALALFLLYYLTIHYLPIVSLVIFLINVLRYSRAKKTGAHTLPRRKQRMIVWGIIFVLSSIVSFIVLTLFRQSLSFM